MDKLTNVDSANDELLIPHAVIEKMVMEGMSPARAWREYLGLSAETVAGKLGIQAEEYASEEAREDLPAHDLARIATALGIDSELLVL